jgi:NDP-sugar pyrophosphorylase family protein
MQVVIPMSGVGKRFVDAGYTVPKPLIEIDGKPIIEHVVSLFPREHEFIFICNEEHIKLTNMKDILKKIAPQGHIVTIPKHKKGPVYAVSQIYDLIRDDSEVIVNYCDFGTYWNYQDFLNHTRSRKADGAIPAYKGFHPHMLGSTNYAFMRQEKQWMLEIQEKKPFTDNRMDEYASNGTYYFRTGAILKKYFDRTMELDDNLNGEYYASVVFNHMNKDNLKISIYEIQHMLQWGTPQDVEEYLLWSNYFSSNQDFYSRAENHVSVDNIILPMAGAGSRFLSKGYELPKPLLPINAKPMVCSAIDSLPRAKYLHLAVLEEHEKLFSVKSSILPYLDKNLDDVRVKKLSKLTQGQASTCMSLVENIPPSESIVIGACDNGMIWNEQNFQELIEKDIDVIVWAFKGHNHAIENPEQYGWILVTEDNNVQSVSVKKKVSDNPRDDWGITGAFYFREAKIFTEAYNKLISENDTINGEFYIDSLINYVDKDRFKVKIIPVDYFVCWGTPDDYETFNYWQSYFHKSETHPYNVRMDRTIPEDKLDELADGFYRFEQEFK